MADINIQRKKSSLSPWWLVLLAIIGLVAAAYFVLRPDQADEPTPPTATAAQTTDTLAATPDTLAATAEELSRQPASTAAGAPGDATSTEAAGDLDTAASLAAQAATNAAAPDYALNGLQKLTGVLASLTDRDDLRDPATSELRNNLTSATARLGEPNASLRPGFVAAASLIRGMQQKAYPELESQANDLTRLAGQLSGRSTTPAEQQQNKQFLIQAAAIVRLLSEPAQL